MAQSLLQVNPINVLGLGTLTTTTTSSVTALPLAESYTIVFDVGAGGGSTPTCDIVMQVSYDKGTTYINAPIRGTQVTTGANLDWITFHNGLGYSAAAATQAGVADTGGILAKNFAFDPTYVKFKCTLSGTSPSFVTKIHIFSNPLGSRSDS